MKKKIYISLLISIVVILFNIYYSYSYVYNEKDITLDTIKNKNRTSAASYIKSKYGSSSDFVTLLPSGKSVLNLHTNLTCKTVSQKNCTVQIGEGKTIQLSNKTTKNILGKNPSLGSNIDIVIEVTVDEKTDITKKQNDFIITIKKISSDSEISNDSEDENESENNGSNEEGNDEESSSDDSSDENNSDEDDVDWWEDKWDDLTNIVGHLKVKLIDILLMPFDGIQSAINSIQTGSFSQKDKLTSWNIVMEPEDILADQNKNQYVGYTKNAENLGAKGQKPQYINARNDGLEDITTIPIIPVEFYSMARGQIDLFDVNFLSGQDNTSLHTSTSKWLILRNFVSAVMHITIYLGAAVLIIKLIIDAIAIVSNSLNPDKRKEAIVDLNDFVKSAIMLVSTVLIMGICIFLSNSMFNDINTSNVNELPIRVNVGSGKNDGTGNKYSFSTNIMGYYRFMAQANRPRTSDLKALYAIIYIVLVVINALQVLVMLVRVIILAILSVLGPIIVIASIFKKKSVCGMTYQGWIINYLTVSSIQLIIAIVYSIILQITF